MKLEKGIKDSLKDIELLRKQSKETSKKVIGKAKRGRGRPKKHIKKSKGISLKVYDELYNQVMAKIETEQQQGIEVSLTGILTKALNDYVKE